MYDPVLPDKTKTRMTSVMESSGSLPRLTSVKEFCQSIRIFFQHFQYILIPVPCVRCRTAKHIDRLYYLIKKYTPLPASASFTMKLPRSLDPSKNDVVIWRLWEGENEINPEANHSAGEITIQSSAVNRIIPKGIEIDLTIIEDEDRKIHVSGYIPDFEYEIPEHTLRAEAKES